MTLNFINSILVYGKIITHLKLLHANTTPTMFLPMSWTSPFTVARTITPEYPDSFLEDKCKY